MAIIQLHTHIKAPLQTCFDLSRSIDLHLISTAKTREKAIAGRTSGLIELHEFVTWQATHFGLRQKLTTRITAFQAPLHFRDEQLRGPFKYMVHDHYFEAVGDLVVMKDVFRFQSPLGLLGRFVDACLLKAYMTRFLKVRNLAIKAYAESGDWKYPSV